MFCKTCKKTYHGCVQRHIRLYHGGRNAGFAQKVADLDRLEPRKNLIFQQDEIFHMILFEINHVYTNFYVYLRQHNVPYRFLREIFITHGSIESCTPIENYSRLSAGIIYLLKLCLFRLFQILLIFIIFVIFIPALSAAVLSERFIPTQLEPVEILFKKKNTAGRANIVNTHFLIPLINNNDSLK